MKRIIPAILIFILVGLSNPCFSQAGLGQRAYQGTGNTNYGYCLSNIELTADQQAKIDKLMAAQQEKMAVLRTKVRTASTWEEKAAYWDQMDALVVKHREEIWAVVPEARAQAGIGRLNRLNSGNINTGYVNTGTGTTGTVVQGAGYYGRAGYGRGRGGAGRGLGRGLGRGAGRGMGRGMGRGYIR